MYAVIATGGKQYRVQKGDRIRVEKLEAEDGTTLTFEPLLVSGEGGVKVGTPTVEGAKVTATVRGQGKHPKVISYKRWEGGWSKIRGHRQRFTELEITEIQG
ncbi:MAG: 50S ribosomal protein L21 [Deltaproteobacteria bacterium]|nr:MAG: 50S ribosomal protein L21 [Deltaproteobacteria bacterium]